MFIDERIASSISEQLRKLQQSKSESVTKLIVSLLDQLLADLYNDVCLLVLGLNPDTFTGEARKQFCENLWLRDVMKKTYTVGYTEARKTGCFPSDDYNYTDPDPTFRVVMRERQELLLEWLTSYQYPSWPLPFVSVVSSEEWQKLIIYQALASIKAFLEKGRYSALEIHFWVLPTIFRYFQFDRDWHELERKLRVVATQLRSCGFSVGTRDVLGRSFNEDAAYRSRRSFFGSSDKDSDGEACIVVGWQQPGTNGIIEPGIPGV